MFRSSTQRLRLPSGWVARTVDAGSLAEGRYSALLQNTSQMDVGEMWFQFATGPKTFALIGGLTAEGKKRVAKDPARLSTFNQQVLIRTWHVEDTLSTGAGTYVPVGSAAVLPYGWVLRDLDPAISFTSRHYLRKELNKFEHDHALWRPSGQIDWDALAQSITGPTPGLSSLIRHGMPDTNTSPSQGSE